MSCRPAAVGRQPVNRQPEHPRKYGSASHSLVNASLAAHSRR